MFKDCESWEADVCLRAVLAGVVSWAANAGRADLLPFLGKYVPAAQQFVVRPPVLYTANRFYLQLLFSQIYLLHFFFCRLFVVPGPASLLPKVLWMVDGTLCLILQVICKSVGPFPVHAPPNINFRHTSWKFSRYLFCVNSPPSFITLFPTHATFSPFFLPLIQGR